MKAIKIPCEHDLLSKNHNVWAGAVMRCKGGNPYCGADGYCHADGKCFADQELTREQAILEVDRLAQELHQAKKERDELQNRLKAVYALSRMRAAVIGSWKREELSIKVRKAISHLVKKEQALRGDSD